MKISRSQSVCAIVLILAGCAAHAEPVGAGPSSSAAAGGEAATPAASAAPSSTAPSGEDAVATTCENVLTPAAGADIDAAGYVLHTELPAGPDVIMASMIDQGGLSCYWASGGDIVAWLGLVAMDDTAWSAQRAELVSDGYTASDDPITGTLQGAQSGDNYPTLVNSDGVTYYVSQPSLLSSVVALQ